MDDDEYKFDTFRVFYLKFRQKRKLLEDHISPVFNHTFDLETTLGF